MQVSDEELAKVEALANHDGEVSKNDFIVYVRQSNMFKSFENVNSESDFHWRKKADTAWNLFDMDRNGFLTQ